MRNILGSRKLHIVLMVLLTGFFLSACKGNHEGRGGMMFDLVAYKLDLTGEQEEKWFAIRDELKLMKANARQEKQAHIEEAKIMLMADSLDQTAVLAKLTQHQEVLRQTAPGIVQKVVEFHATLTQEQKEKVVDMMDHFAKKGKHEG
ncbi:hypothetical protein A9Q99_15960 [Gammaproteobacteria bacterium 45_16_T64]|nr:hypothetical protein A9Q99_15960 [Gammaproteobacteria bacterium 45_16_T64]